MSDTRIALRPFEAARDWPAAAELIAVSHLHDAVDWVPTAEILEHEWGPTPSFDPGRDVQVVDDADGRLAAMAAVDWRERDPGLVVHHIEIWVRPDRRRQGLGTALLDWSEAHARSSARAGRAGRLDWPHFLGGWGDTHVPGPAGFAARHGYAEHRHGFEMLRSVADPISDEPLPAGLEVRPVEVSQHRAIWDADVEAFRDHPEPARRTEADFVSWFSAPTLDTTLWQVAWDDEDVAGSVLTSISPEENARLGVNRAWLDHVSVRRPWRKRGLAASLIASTLRLLRERGVEQAALGVDAENPTGALRLYERLGFRVHREGVGYRKALELEPSLAAD